MVRRIDRRDDHRVRPRLGQHPPKICGQISGRNRRAILRRTPPSQFDATGVDIAEAHQLGVRRVDRFNPILIQFVARTEPHDCIAATLGRLRGWLRCGGSRHEVNRQIILGRKMNRDTAPGRRASTHLQPTQRRHLKPAGAARPSNGGVRLTVRAQTSARTLYKEKSRADEGAGSGKGNERAVAVTWRE